MPILIPLPEKLKNLEAPIRSLIEQASRQLALFERPGRRVDYQGAERALSQSVAGIERAVHATWLEGLVIDAPEVVIDGQRYRRVLESSGTYYTLAGPVSVVRPLFDADVTSERSTLSPCERVPSKGPGCLQPQL